MSLAFGWILVRFVEYKCEFEIWLISLLHMSHIPKLEIDQLVVPTTVKL